MLSAVICSRHSYPAFTPGGITGTLASNFYPLSDGLSTQHRRITKADFRLCLTCQSRSQAPFCFYTLWLISVQPEGTFAHLHYLLGGDCPSQTARLKLSSYRMTVKTERSSLPRVVSH
eukprot:7972288-Pyramimonas_sp.AAC.1